LNLKEFRTILQDFKSVESMAWKPEKEIKHTSISIQKIILALDQGIDI